MSGLHEYNTGFIGVIFLGCAIIQYIRENISGAIGFTVSAGIFFLFQFFLLLPTLGKGVKKDEDK